MANLSLNGNSNESYTNQIYVGTQNIRPVTILNCTNITLTNIETDGQSILDNTFLDQFRIEDSNNITLNYGNVHDGGNLVGFAYGGGVSIRQGCTNIKILNTKSKNHYEHCMQCYSSNSLNPVSNITFSGGEISGSTGHGLNVGFYSSIILVEKILSYSNTRFGLVADAAVDNVVFKNNICLNNTIANIGAEGNIDIGVANNIDYYHNTLVGGNGFRFTVGATVSNVKFKNNIVVTNGNESIRVPNGTTLDYNCYYDTTGNYLFIYDGTTYNTFAEYKAATGQDLHSITSDPLLTADYKLKPGSPAINAGATGLNVTDDYYGHLRIGTPDIGAVEFGTFIGNATLGNITIGN